MQQGAALFRQAVRVLIGDGEQFTVILQDGIRHDCVGAGVPTTELDVSPQDKVKRRSTGTTTSNLDIENGLVDSRTVTYRI